jgi:hypothetical protein
VVPERQREIEETWIGGEILGFTGGSRGGFIAHDKVKFITSPAATIEIRWRYRLGLQV